MVSERPKSPVSLKNSLFAGNLAGDGCDPDCVASHPVLQFAEVHNLRHTAPEIRAFPALELVSRLPVSATQG